MSDAQEEAFRELLRLLKHDFSGTDEGRAMLNEMCAGVAALPGCTELAAAMSSYLLQGDAP